MKLFLSQNLYIDSCFILLYFLFVGKTSISHNYTVNEYEVVKLEINPVHSNSVHYIRRCQLESGHSRASSNLPI